MTLRGRIADFILGNEAKRRDAVMSQLVAVYSEIATQNELAQLQEQFYGIDNAMIDLIDEIQFERLSMDGASPSTSEARRQRAIRIAFDMWVNSPVFQFGIWSWTSSALGEGVTVTPVDDAAKQVWNEFWTAPRNSRMLSGVGLRNLSYWTLIKGERFLVYFTNRFDGTTTVRQIVPSEITEILTHKNDSIQPVWYKRAFMEGGTAKTLWYPDWEALLNGQLEEVDKPPPMDKRANEARDNTIVVMQHISFNQKDEQSLRGWPISTVGSTSIREHKNYLQDRLTVARGKASAIREWTVGSGSRGVAAIQSALASNLSSSQWTDTNPPPVAGSNLIHNQAVEMRDLPMTTGAGDANLDHNMFAWYALISMGLFPYAAGLDTQRYATALSMDKNLQILLNSYGGFWAENLRDMAAIVLRLYEVAHG